MKYLNFRNNASVVINKLTDISKVFTPSEKVYLIDDASDNKFLELAKESQSDFLITGNTSDFNFGSFENTKIVTPRIYFESFKPF